MSIGRYIASLVPSFEKSMIEEDVRLLKQELNNHTLGPYEAASHFFTVNPFHSSTVKKFDSTFGSQVNARREFKGHFIKTVHLTLREMTKTLDQMDGVLDGLFGKDVAQGGLTFQRANFIRYVETAGFVSQYARKLLIWVYAEEKKTAGRSVGEPFTKAQLEFLLSNQNAFFNALEVMGVKTDDVMRQFKKIPQAEATPDNANIMEKTIGAATLNPYKAGLIPVVLNPIYHVRMAAAEFMVHRYKVAEEEKRVLEYRLLALKDIQNEQGDPKLEQQIEYTEARIKKLSYKMAKIIGEA